MANVKFLYGEGPSTNLPATHEAGRLLFTVSGSTPEGYLYYDNGASYVLLYESVITDVASAKAAIDKLNGDKTLTGSVANSIEAAIAALNMSQYAKTEDIEDLVASIEAGHGITVDDEDPTAPKVSIKIDSESTPGVVSVGEGGLKVVVPTATDYTIGVASATESLPTGVAKRYTITQANATGNDKSWNIDIPSDMVVSGATVVKVEDYPNDKYTDTDVDKNGYYLKLTIANAEKTELYVDLSKVADVYTAAQNADQVQIAVSGYTISASLVNNAVATAHIQDEAVTEDKLADDAVTADKIKNGEVSSDKLSADAVTTAKIKDAQITEEKLDESLKTKINNSTSALTWLTFADASTGA